MSWFTDNIRDPLEAKLMPTGQAAPASPTANSNKASANGGGFMDTPYFVPLAIIAGIVLLSMFLKHKG